VPLHRWRRVRRGFNQAEEIARGVAEVLERPLVCALRRRRATRALHEVPREDRGRVVDGAFALASFAPSLRARPIALVDDIRTSGATLREAAAVLHAAGADRIDALVVAR
jgi:predicted amidophosphoribosyltransferase